MADFLATRERQKLNAVTEIEKDVAQSVLLGVENQEPKTELEDDLKAPKRVRGKTKMNKVHTRNPDKRPIIRLNGHFQPIADDNKILSEFSNFLGTISRQYVSLSNISWKSVPDEEKQEMWDYVKVRYIIPEEAKPWVMKTIRDSWRLHKCRIKTKHYKAYNNDEKRIENKPDDIPLEEFKILLKYWGDEKIRALAEKNTTSQNGIKDVHTTGPRSFAQETYMMKKKKPENASPTQAEVFAKTRQQKEGRVYQSSTAVLKYRISKINKASASSGEKSNVELVFDDTSSHGKDWLIGRNMKHAKMVGNAPTDDTYIHELTTKIRGNLVDEMEAQLKKKMEEEMDAKVNKKVQENLTWALKKLGEANPNMKVDIVDLCASILSDDDNGTPITQGDTST